MKFELYTQVVLLTDLPDYHLKAGDLVTLVEFLEGNENLAPAYVVEVFDAIGQTLAVLTVAETKLVSLQAGEVLSVRKLQQAA